MSLKSPHADPEKWRRGAPSLPTNCWRRRIYVAIQLICAHKEIEFDWDEGNTTHLAAHQVTPAEFEQVLNNDPLDLDYESVDNEDRYRAVGLTDGGRLLSVVFMVRNGKVRGITAFPANALDKKAFLERIL